MLLMYLEAVVRIAIIGCGEVGSAYAQALLDAAVHDIVLVDPHPPQRMLELAGSHHLTIHAAPSAVLGAADVVWLCVAGDLAHEVLADVLPWLRDGVRVVDLTTASPRDKRRSADLMGHLGSYVDAVIMGAIAMGGVSTPLLAAGPLAEGATAELVEIGAPVRCLPDAGTGDAAALKLLRSVLTKGLEALGVECFAAAEQMGVRRELPAVLADIDSGGLTPFLEAVVRTHPLHAERRRHEVARAGLQLAGQGRPSGLVTATEARFAATSAALAQHPPAPGTINDLDGALRWLLSTTPTTHD